MENASKALRIAGAVLLGLMVTSLLLFAFNMWQKYQKTNIQTIQNQQTTKFNSTFDAYNKKALRGSELVSLANKVNSANRTLAGKSDYITYGIKNMDYRYPETQMVPIRVFVAFTIVQKKDDFSNSPINNGYLPGILVYEGNNKEDFYMDKLTEYNARDYLSYYNKNNSDFPGANQSKYYYIDLDEYIQKLYNNDEFTTFAKQSSEKVDVKKEFKDKYFQCTGIKFDDQTGRYSRMFFKEVFKLNKED